GIKTSAELIQFAIKKAWCPCSVPPSGLRIMTMQQRVLLADDHAEFLGVVARHLEPHFDVVRTVDNGLAMLDEATRLEPDVVVTDISMPGLNGIEAAGKLKETGSRAKIVFLTVHADREYVLAALGAGAVGFVLKSSRRTSCPA